MQHSTLLTSGLFVAFLALSSRIISNRRLPKCFPDRLDTLVVLKALLGSIYIAGTITMLISAEKQSTSIHSWVLLCTAVVTAIAFTGASISEHYHSIAPSTLTSLYAVIAAAVYGYVFRGLYDTQTPSLYFYAGAAAAGSTFILIFLESKSKRQLLIPADPPPAYESTLSFLVKPFFPHITLILFTGARRRITLPELRYIPLYLRSDPATQQLLAALAVEDQSSGWYLAKSTFRAFKRHFLSPILPRLIFLACTFAQISLVEALVSYVSDTSIPKERGAVIVVAYFDIYVSLAISNYVYSEKINTFIMLYRSALTGALYAKTLRLKSMAARELGQGAATTYMSVDVEKVTNGFQTLQELWAAVLTIGFACTMLWIKAGYAPSAAPSAAQKAWLAAIDTSVLGQLLPIKLGAYEGPLSPKINALRDLETRALGGFLYLIALAATLSNFGGSAAFFVTLAAYVVMLAKGWGSLKPLNVSLIFTLFATVDLLTVPLNSIGQTLPQLFTSFASLGRIQRFLQLPEKSESESEQEFQETPNLVDVTVGENGAAKVSTSTVEVSMEGCTFTWDDKTTDKAPVLQDIMLALAPCALHMVVGSVASGKSSLLMSILGETALVGGTMKVQARKVIHACGLRQDIETLPRRDMTKLGDKGTGAHHSWLDPRFRADNGKDW
ncbi:hypothetical protein B0H19DRAFT_1084217 [Mycena capillaripes]|nr:hypothetical protein B0H19DRAFT_1084217 [Mycena capillaripes]